MFFIFIFTKLKSNTLWSKKNIHRIYYCMRISSVNNYKIYSANNMPICNRHTTSLSKCKNNDSRSQIDFKGNIFTEIRNFKNFVKAVNYANSLYRASKRFEKPFILREFCMEPLEGLQYGIKVFKGLSMKDIQYLSENLHVVAVKRGCSNMCGYCYADAKPSNIEMSFEDFSSIADGFKTLRRRMHGLDLFGKNIPIDDPIYKTTELFYDADCMNLVLKDRNGNAHDFTELAAKVYNDIGRQTVFDTFGWYHKNPLMQKRAERYAEHFSKPENMKQLKAFNLSFNPFNASYIASVKSRRAGDIQKAARLRDRFTTNMANALFTFTPLLKYPEFNVMVRSFPPGTKNAAEFDGNATFELILETINKVSALYQNDLNGAKKYVKSQRDIDDFLEILITAKFNQIETGLNSAGRMKEFLKEFNIKAKLQNHEKIVKPMIEDLQENGRSHECMALRLIDTDGMVYHMNYAKFIPTEIQLNLSNKDIKPPKLANLVENYTLTKEVLNRSEVWIMEQPAN